MSTYSDSNFLFGVPLIIPECINFCLLLISIVVVYRGIEISHPIYAVMFCNLVVAFFSTILNLIAYVSCEVELFYRLNNANNAVCMLFNCNAWLVKSLLKYIFIVHGSWIDEKFSNQINLTRLAITLTFLFCAILTLPWMTLLYIFGEYFFNFHNLIFP